MAEKKPLINPFEGLPPHDMEAEEAVLAACMVDPEAMARCAAIVTPSDFFREKNGQIFAAELRVYAIGSVIDPITVLHELSQKNELDQPVGMSDLMRMIARCPTTVGEGAEWYAQIVKDAAIRRSVIHACSGVLQAAYTGGETVEELFAQAEGALNRVRSGKVGGHRGMDADEAVRAAYDEIIMFLEDPSRLRGFRTPWWRLNYLLDGLVKGRFIVWGAATSVGKSLGLQNIARELLIAGVPVLMFTTEMTEKEVAARLIHMQAGVDAFEIRHRGHALPREREALANAADVVRQWPLRLEPGPQTPASIRAKTRLYQDLMGAEVVLLDHMGQGFVTGDGEKETERIGHVTSSLVNLALELDVATLAVSHINRDSRRENRLTELRDLYGSVHIEQDAHQVVLQTPVTMKDGAPVAMSDQEATVAKARDGGVAVWFQVAKNRFGATGGTDLFLSWARHGGRFIDPKAMVESPDAGTQGELVA